MDPREIRLTSSRSPYSHSLIPTHSLSNNSLSIILIPTLSLLVHFLFLSPIHTVCITISHFLIQSLSLSNIFYISFLYILPLFHNPASHTRSSKISPTQISTSRWWRNVYLFTPIKAANQIKLLLDIFSWRGQQLWSKQIPFVGLWRRLVLIWKFD